jgi:D-lactate dehydrogenase
VIINPDRRAHLEDLKRIPTIEPEVDKCIECGYCESKCPSRELTLTPGQRIVVRREMARLQNISNATKGSSPVRSGAPPMSSATTDDRVRAKELYAALDTGAADGLCPTACPVNIDTGQLVKRFRCLRQSPSAQEWAVRIATHFAAPEKIVRWGVASRPRRTTVIGAGGNARSYPHVQARSWRQRG